MYTLNLRGEQGGIYINNTDVTTPETGASHWAACLVITDTVIAAITQTKFTNEAALVGVTLLAGTVIYGEISSIQLTSGTVQMFNFVDPNKAYKG